MGICPTLQLPCGDTLIEIEGNNKKTTELESKEGGAY